ncbi:hypothetical protein CYMTET_6163 [Cymbomonas tetramitiformis]|uniref:RNase H type-1 domain-containing protein n=1 Tax=Cymbomonas tetramitiformis TaxID=36881 RepID=A0AAE0GY02_9CHLO|nr:hypothetical protein CYMTET_6163 [Cymbomonas tetramitiformis]
MERRAHRDLLYTILCTIEALQDALVTVEILKVKAHIGIDGNEQADKAAKQACEDGEYVQPWDNDDTLLLQARATDQEGVKYLLKGKHAVQTHVTKMIREANANEPAVQRWNRTLMGEPTEWMRKAPPNTRNPQPMDSGAGVGGHVGIGKGGTGERGTGDPGVGRRCDDGDGGVADGRDASRRQGEGTTPPGGGTGGGTQGDVGGPKAKNGIGRKPGKAKKRPRSGGG